jgi:hypothetical protein
MKVTVSNIPQPPPPRKLTLELDEDEAHFLSTLLNGCGRLDGFRIEFAARPERYARYDMREENFMGFCDYVEPGISPLSIASSDKTFSNKAMDFLLRLREVQCQFAPIRGMKFT